MWNTIINTFWYGFSNSKCVGLCVYESPMINVCNSSVTHCGVNLQNDECRILKFRLNGVLLHIEYVLVTQPHTSFSNLFQEYCSLDFVHNAFSMQMHFNINNVKFIVYRICLRFYEESKSLDKREQYKSFWFALSPQIMFCFPHHWMHCFILFV